MPSHSGRKSPVGLLPGPSRQNQARRKEAPIEGYFYGLAVWFMCCFFALSLKVAL